MDWFHSTTSDFPVTSEYFCNVPHDCFLVCQLCDINVATVVPKTAKLVDNERPWFVRFDCHICLHPFYWCRVCKPSQIMFGGRHLHKNWHLNKHERGHHHTANMKVLCEQLINDQQVEDSVVHANDDTVITDSLEPTISPVPQSAETTESCMGEISTLLPFPQPDVDWLGLFPNHENAEFFENQAAAVGYGFSKIACTAIRNNQLETVHPLVSLYMLLFSKLNESFTVSQSTMLSWLLNFSCQSLSTSLSSITKAPLPTSIQQMNAMFGDRANSVRNNLPKVKLQKCGAYIVAKPSDCLREAVGLGIAEVFYPGNAVVQSKSPRGLELIKFAHSTELGKAGKFNLYHLFLWEDDMDPNNIKDNRHKVFVQVLSVAPPDTAIHSTRNTYVICIGPSHEDRTLAQRMIASDLEELARGISCYHAKEKCVVPTIALIFSIQADSPAKATATRLLAGNSPFHCRFGYVGDISGCAADLVSCSTCWTARREGKVLSEECTTCYDWCFDRLSYPTPADYPDTTVGLSIKFQRICIQSLRRACSQIFCNVATGIWKTKAVARCYGRTEGLTVDLVDDIFRLAKSNSTMDSDKLHPPTWNFPNTTLSSWVPVPMHLLFLGISKATFGEFIINWLTARKRKTAHTRFVNDRLQLLSKLNLPWLKAETLSVDGKFGRYVSENYLAYVKVCKWLYAHMGGSHEMDHVYTDPDGKAISDYTLNNLRDWLKARRILFLSSMSKEELYQICVDAIDSNNGCFPPIAPIPQQHSTLEMLESLVSALHAMISRIMIPGEVADMDALDCDRHVKHFLSAIAAFLSNEPSVDSSGGAKKRLPEFITKYNFINLLSVPEAMKRYYSLRYVWEGDGKGEGALPLLKQKCIKSLKGDNWALNAMTNYYNLRGIDRCTAALVKNLSDEGIEHYLKEVAENAIAKDLHETKEQVEGNNRYGLSNVVDHHSVDAKGNHLVYQDEDAFAKDWDDHYHPLSVVQASTGMFYAVCKGERFIKLNCLSGVTEHIQHCGACYHKWEYSPSRDTSCKANNSEITKHFLMLPHHERELHQYYYLISSDWEEMIGDGSIRRSQAIGVKYAFH